MSDVVLFEQLQTANGRLIGVATLNTEKTLNALSLEMTDLLAAQLAVWADDGQVAMVVLQAAGDKAFCAGGDLQQLYRTMVAHHASGQRGDIAANDYATQFFEREYRLDYAIGNYPKPLLYWGHGIVMGGGIGLMAGASHRVVTERSRLAMPESAIGLYPDVGGSWFLSRMPGKLGLFLALTGASINAADAKFVKLADFLITQSQKQAVFDALVAQPWDGAQDNHVLLGRVLQQAEAEATTVTTTPFAPSVLRAQFDRIETLCAAQTLPEIFAAILSLQMDDDAPDAAWLRKAAAALSKSAPGSAWLSYALQRKVKHMSLAEVFRLEYIVTLNCAAGHDFAEGIRALIIDKDQQPKWQPAALADGSLQSA